MRKIISQEKVEKKRRRNQLIIGGILILVMALSTIGYSLSGSNKSSSTSLKYNGFEFTKTSGLWNTNAGSFQFSFQYNPNEAEKTNSVLNPLSSYQGKPLYIYTENSEAGTEIYRNLFYQNQIVQRVQEACLEADKCAENAPAKTCDDNFIVIRKSSNIGISQNKSCVFIEGKSEDLIKLSDSFLYKITGIQ
ncbi:Uncharacterised protein [uncultured archaeon]|nr:Uncharacterised protein [uncultured archaeon]